MKVTDHFHFDTWTPAQLLDDMRKHKAEIDRVADIVSTMPDDDINKDVYIVGLKLDVDYYNACSAAYARKAGWDGYHRLTINGK